MQTAILSSTDYDKIIRFATNIVKPVKDIRLTILSELSTNFGYDETIFWYANDDGEIREPVIYRLSEKFLNAYLEEFHHHDILHPKRNLHLFQEKGVVTIDDVITMEQYNSSFYYRSFMQSHGFYDEMGVALIHENKWLGIIGVAQKKHYYFTDRDYARFMYLSKIITNVLLHQFKEDLDYSMLSEREEDVVKLVKEGWTNKNIAEELHISINTVKKHLQNIYQKHAVQNRTQLIRKLKMIH